MIKNDGISEEMLEKLGVYELRELARSIGVSSPTTKKRKELCEHILKISRGEQKVEVKRTNKGRPPKTVGKITSFINEFIPEEIVKIQKHPDNNNILTLAQNTFKLNSNEEKQVYGFINSISGQFYIKNLKYSNEFKDMVFYLPNELVVKYSLRGGDKIVANGKIADSCYCGIIEDILKINNEEIGLYDSLKIRKNCDLSNIEIPSVEEVFLNETIKKGERILTYYSKQEEAIVGLLEELENESDKVILLGIELAPEMIFYIKSKKNVESFTTGFYNSLDESFETIQNSFNYANTLLREGKSVKYIIFDIMGILSRLSLYYANETGRHLGYAVSSIQMLKKLIGVGQAFSKDLHLTTISVTFENERENEVIKNELEKIFNRTLKA